TAGASHRHMIEHLTGPFSAGALDDELPISGSGRIAARDFREALVVLAPRSALVETSLRVTASLDPDAGNTPITPALEFAPYSDAVAFLPLYRPRDPFTIALQAQVVAE